MPRVPFKDWAGETDNKMTIKCTLRFLRAGGDEDSDDVIIIRSMAVSPDLFYVSYRPGDASSRLSYEASMSRGATMDYVTDVLKSMCYDVDPFDRLQVLTDMHPSVMYSVSDMDNVIARKLVENMVYTCLRTRVLRVRRAAA